MYLFEMKFVLPCSSNNNWPVYSVLSVLDSFWSGCLLLQYVLALSSNPSFKCTSRSTLGFDIAFNEANCEP